MLQRMEQRLQDWGNLWHIRQENQPPNELPRPSTYLEPDKASGPDAVSTQLLKSAPPLALGALLQLYQTMEGQAYLKTPKWSAPSPSHPYSGGYGVDSESRSWISCKNSCPSPWIMEQDQVPMSSMWPQNDFYARKPTKPETVMESPSWWTCPRSMTRSNLENSKEALKLNRTKSGHGRAQHVPAGCPQAPLLAKAVLAPALIPWKEQHAQVYLSSWVDDVGFDTAGQTPLQVAQEAVAAYRDLHAKLVDLGLRVNPKKTAFIATDKATDKALKNLLTPQEPPVTSVMRDLGVDHQAARRRRIPVLRQRFNKAKQRKRAWPQDTEQP